jgi:hypothetical protein
MKTVLLVVLLLCFVPFLSCFLGGGDDGDDCVKCNLASETGFEVCPKITKQCSFGTITVQQCSGAAGSSQGCCATTPEEVSCGSILAQIRNAPYKVVDDIITFELAEEDGRLHVKIDAIANGWISGAMNAAEKERIIQSKIALISSNSEQ